MPRYLRPFRASWDPTRSQYMLECRICGTTEYEGGDRKRGHGGWDTPAAVRDRGIERHNETGHFPRVEYRWAVEIYNYRESLNEGSSEIGDREVLLAYIAR